MDSRAYDAPMQISRLCVLAVLGLALVACGDDHSHDEGEGSHDPKSPTCAAIMDVCHDVDTGDGEIAMCHDIAHADVEAECSDHELHCIPLCEAAAADGGGHDEDGGHEEH